MPTTRVANLTISIPMYFHKRHVRPPRVTGCQSYIIRVANGIRSVCVYALVERPAVRAESGKVWGGDGRAGDCGYETPAIGHAGCVDPGGVEAVEGAEGGEELGCEGYVVYIGGRVGCAFPIALVRVRQSFVRRG